MLSLPAGGFWKVFGRFFLSIGLLINNPTSRIFLANWGFAKRASLIFILKSGSFFAATTIN